MALKPKKRERLISTGGPYPVDFSQEAIGFYDGLYRRDRRTSRLSANKRETYIFWYGVGWRERDAIEARTVAADQEGGEE